jgi:hypothetical protein
MPKPKGPLFLRYATGLEAEAISFPEPAILGKEREATE